MESPKHILPQDAPAILLDDDRTFEWKPATMQANYEKYAEAFGPDVIEWDGLLLDGWLPLGAQPPLSHRSG